MSPHSYAPEVLRVLRVSLRIAGLHSTTVSAGHPFCRERPMERLSNVTKSSQPGKRDAGVAASIETVCVWQKVRGAQKGQSEGGANLILWSTSL